MKPQKHKTAVRIFCLVFAAMMVLRSVQHHSVLVVLRRLRRSPNSKEPSDP